MDKNIPFPQADDFNKILVLLNVEDTTDLNNKEKLRLILKGIADRQIQYYLSACMYLGILDKKKEFTNIGKETRELSTTKQEAKLAQLIISHDVFGYIYFLEKELKIKLVKEDIIDIMKKFVKLESEEVYIRRSQTVIKWLEWINKRFNDIFN